MDAGFWTAMRIKPTWLRDMCSMVFSIYYLIVAEQADEKVRRVRGVITVDHLRVSWNKGTSPYLGFLNNLLRPRLMRYKPRAIRIPRPRDSAYRDSVDAWLYFDGPISELKNQTKVVLDIPGGGFVAMTPRNHDDKLLAWAGRTGLPVLSLDYKKAPEYPYPYALNECYDVYHTIIATRGKCIGMSGEEVPKVVIAGDSAGGNLAVGTMTMILQSGSSGSRRWLGEQQLPVPEGLILIYPALDMNIGSWMTDEQMALIRDRRTRKRNEGVLRQKSEDYKKLTPSTPYHSDDDMDDADSPAKKSNRLAGQENGSVVTVIHDKLSTQPSMAHISSLDATKTSTTNAAAEVAETAKPRQLKTRLAMSSMISYFNDRILTPEMMRAMVILYVGPHNKPNFATDFLLCPLLAPESILARFPKTYFLTGERDPLVDDTVIFAGRIRQAHATRVQERQDLGLEHSGREFREEDYVEVKLIPGISHGFLQFVGVFPQGWKYIFRIGEWIQDIFEQSDDRGARRNRQEQALTPVAEIKRHHRRMRTGDSSADEDRPLEMSVLKKDQRMGGASAKAYENGRIAKATSPDKARTRTLQERRRRSLVRLASEDDLVGRRMRGFTTSLLMDDSGDIALPPTP
jgi:acetyl esterase/lipase